MVLFSSIGCILVFAGILNLMLPAAVLIVAFGLLWPAAERIKNRREPLLNRCKGLFTPGMIIFAVVIIYLYF